MGRSLYKTVLKWQLLACLLLFWLFMCSFIIFNSRVSWDISFSIGWFSLMNLIDCIELKELVQNTNLCLLCYRFLSRHFLLLIFPLYVKASTGKVSLLVQFRNTAAKPTFFPLVLDLSMYTALLFLCFSIFCIKYCFFSVSFCWWFPLIAEKLY